MNRGSWKNLGWKWSLEIICNNLLLKRGPHSRCYQTESWIFVTGSFLCATYPNPQFILWWRISFLIYELIFPWSNLCPFPLLLLPCILMKAVSSSSLFLRYWKTVISSPLNFPFKKPNPSTFLLMSIFQSSKDLAGTLLDSLHFFFQCLFWAGGNKTRYRITGMA